MDKKTDLRISAKNIRKNLNMAVLSQKAVRLIRDSVLYKKSQKIMIYHPLKNEISLMELLKDEKEFYLPRVKDKYLEVCPYKYGEELYKSSLGIMEPASKSVSKSILDLVIVPALMIDSENNRLGYGGGYYDRFLSQEFESLAVIPKELYIQHLPSDEYDKKIDEILVI